MIELFSRNYPVTTYYDGLETMRINYWGPLVFELIGHYRKSAGFLILFGLSP